MSRAKPGPATDDDLSSVAPPPSSGLKDPHKAAAVAYGGLGVLVIAITFAAGLVPASRQSATLELGIGAIFIVIFAALIYRGWWPVSAILVFSNGWRAFTFLNDGLGRHVELWPFSVTPIEPRPAAFLNAALMVIIAFMLARSAWLGFSTWRARRQEGARTVEKQRIDANWRE
ncbi:MAG: hypothetical protein L0332_11575 [Chloroflexi bacterium]|nr:hypothetical protein [Chloroflexota bacterium]MCI0580684.1 hypothetical protein [Chloroflexota bacterium]MCI0648585.1 hypothetical protein [Chloroflexota bacterium]MCI0727348.1 hypothetical protein [Chloroflexota bacterium]